MHNEASQQASTSGTEITPEQREQLFIEATGGRNPKGRIYGLGSQANSTYGSTNFGNQSTIIYQSLKEQIAAEVRAELQDKIATEVRSELQDQFAREMQRVYTQLQEHFGVNINGLGAEQE